MFAHTGRRMVPTIVERTPQGEIQHQFVGWFVDGQATEILRMRAVMEDILARHTRRDREQIRADLARDTVLAGAEALAYGVVDTVLGSRKLSAQLAADLAETVGQRAA